MKIKVLLVAMLVTVSGCNVENANREQISKDSQSKEMKTPSPQQSALVQDASEIIDRIPSDKLSKYPITINGEKYIAETAQLTKGSKVFNLLMREYGTIKGSVVVVTNALNQTSLKQHFNLASVVEIAKHTYRLYPKDDAKVYSLYQSLVSDNVIERSELEIDFSGETSSAEKY
ncbi:hypothetical protein [Thalassotalea sp. G2M2-11]|uniref:hypothetical protein n=1 Tax=Thalassotalea sp. G2M2-11 TaxID=2787627 RepID=UPI0019D13D6A|nr:hypothetical protein [Thalassotalea sp. G2M2-11]